MSDARANAEFTYDVCLSFAGEDRDYVSKVAEALRNRGARVFYDRYETATLWGKDLYEHLDYVYRRAARFCIVFASEAYAKKLWTNHERKSAQSRAFSENSEYLLPARFDDTEIPGIRPTVGYIDLRIFSPVEFSNIIAQKVSPFRLLEFHSREDYFPPNPDILFKYMKARSERARYFINTCSREFHTSLQRMNAVERRLIATIFYGGCPHDKPNNAHIELGLLRRITKVDENDIKNMLLDIRPLGFESKISKLGSRRDRRELVTLRWHHWSEALDPFSDERSNSDLTDIVWAIFEVLGRNYCLDHAIETVVKNNFSALSTVTAVDDIH